MERTGLWQRFTAPYQPGPRHAPPRRPARQPAELTAQPLTVRYETTGDPQPIIVPARGDTFQFHLVPHLRWAATGLTVAELARRCAAYESEARSAVLRRVWATARRFDPTDVEHAEAAVNKELAGGWEYVDAGVPITCTPAVLVMLDPILREHRLSVERRRLALRAELDLGIARADVIQRITERWLDALGQMEGTGHEARPLLLPYAASLTDETFASVLHGLAAHRMQLTTDLAAVLQQAAANHEHVGLYEFANAYDKALRSFCRQVGLDPFAWASPAPQQPASETQSRLDEDGDDAE